MNRKKVQSSSVIMITEFITNKISRIIWSQMVTLLQDDTVITNRKDRYNRLWLYSTSMRQQTCNKTLRILCFNFSVNLCIMFFFVKNVQFLRLRRMLVLYYFMSESRKCNSSLINLIKLFQIHFLVFCQTQTKRFQQKKTFLLFKFGVGPDIKTSFLWTYQDNKYIQSSSWGIFLPCYECIRSRVD